MLKFKNKRVKNQEEVKCSPDSALPSSVSSPFQAIVTKKDKEFVNRDLLREISMETLKSPIMKTAKAAPPQEEKPQPPPQEQEITEPCNEGELDEIIEFAPQYVLENDVSSIAELKEVIAKKKPPKISFIINNDLSRVSQSERESLEKINSLDTEKIIGAIKKSVDDIGAESTSKAEQTPGSYSFSCISPETPAPETKEYIKPKHLTADEIIKIHRKEIEDKKSQTAAFLAQKSETMSMEDLAKLYFQGAKD